MAFGLVLYALEYCGYGYGACVEDWSSFDFYSASTSIFHRLHTFSLRPRACMYHVATLVRLRKRYSVWHSVFFFPLTLHSILCVDSCF